MSAAVTTHPDAEAALRPVSWATASAEVKRGLPTPPEPSDFPDAAAYDIARAGWVRRVLPVLATRQAAWERTRAAR